jgi:hypothetical protein
MPSSDGEKVNKLMAKAYIADDVIRTIIASKPMSDGENKLGNMSKRKRQLLTCLFFGLMIGGILCSTSLAEDGIVYPDSARVMFTRDITFDTVLVTVTNLAGDSVLNFFLTDYSDTVVESLECQVDGVVRDDILNENETGNVYPGKKTICWVVGGFQSSVRIKYHAQSNAGDDLSWSAGHPFPIFGIIEEQGGGIPPEPFPLFGPADGTIQIDYYMRFIWGRAIDLDSNASVSYTIQVSPDSLFNGVHNIRAGLADTALTIETDSIGVLGLFYWRVLAIDNLGLVRISGIPEGPNYMTILPAGDANANGATNGLDVTFLVNYFKGYTPPDPLLAGDANGNCHTNGVDVVYLVNFLKGVGDDPIRGDCAGRVAKKEIPKIEPVDKSDTKQSRGNR